jgi:sugar lactone lactonase YvrE
MDFIRRPGRWLGLLAVCALAFATRAASAQKIQTIIGPANEDGLLATQVMLHGPWDVIIEPNGSVLVLEIGALRVDGSLHLRPQIRRIASDGKITRIAGNFQEGDTGDGGRATDASFIFPDQMAQDASGNIYVVDRVAHRVRKIDTEGNISTLAGNGTAGYAGDGGSAAESQLSAPRGVAVDAQGNVYIADSGNHRVRRVDAQTGVIDTFAGTGVPEFGGDGGPAREARLASPRSLAVDTQGNLYIADYTNARIRKVDTNGIITTVAGNGGEGAGGDGGPALDATVQNPWSIDVDAQGNLYLVQFGLPRVRRVSPDGQITSIAGTGQPGFGGDGGPAAQALLNLPVAVTADASGNVLIADITNSRLRRVAADGRMTTFAGGGDPTGMNVSQVTVLLPRGGVRDAQGNFYVSDEGHPRILRIAPDGIVTQIAGTGVPGGYAGEGKRGTEVGLGSAELGGFFADGLALDAAGNLFIPDLYQGRVYKLDTNGILTTAAGNGEAGYSGDGGPATAASLSEGFWNIAIDAQGNLYIADGDNHRVRRVNAQTGVIDTFAGNGSETYSGDGGKATEAGIPGPDGLAFGPDGSLYIADTIDARVRKVAPDGTITTVAGTGEDDFTGDGGPATEAAISVFTDNIAVDAQGNLYLADGANNRIRRVNAADGVINTFAGTGIEGFNGDDKPLLETNITEPRDIYTDAAGNIIIAEWGTGGVPSDRIRIITPAQ